MINDKFKNNYESEIVFSFNMQPSRVFVFSYNQYEAHLHIFSIIVSARFCLLLILMTQFKTVFYILLILEIGASPRPAGASADLATDRELTREIIGTTTWARTRDL